MTNKVIVPVGERIPKKDSHNENEEDSEFFCGEGHIDPIVFSIIAKEESEKKSKQIDLIQQAEKDIKEKLEDSIVVPMRHVRACQFENAVCSEMEEQKIIRIKRPDPTFDDSDAELQEDIPFVEISLDRTDEQDYELWTKDYESELEDIFSSPETKSTVRKLKFKKLVNDICNIWAKILYKLKIKKSYDPYKRVLPTHNEYEFLIGKILKGMSVYNDKNIPKIDLMLKDRCVEGILSQRPSIEDTLKKQLELNKAPKNPKNG